MKFSGKIGNGPMKKSSAVAEMGYRLATIDMGQKVGAAVPLSPGVAKSPSNTMSPGPRPTYTPSGILIHSTVWPQCTHTVARAEAYLRAKFHLDSFNRLATMHQRHRQDRTDRQDNGLIA